MRRTLPPAAATLLTAGALSALVAVGCGAFGSHAFKSALGAGGLATWNTAVLYHLVHSIGLVALGLLLLHLPQSAWLKASGWTMAAGIVLFSGSLYFLVLTEMRWLAYVTPVGGGGLLAGWLLLAIAISRA